MKNKNKLNFCTILIIFLIIIIIILLLFLYSKNFKFKNDFSKSNNLNNYYNDNDNENNNIIISSYNQTISKKNIEKELSSFSTNLNGSSSNRLTNIKITCNKLNNTIIKQSSTFSFEDTIGPSKAEDGYKEATSFYNGKKVQTLGGGNCQVSSTLYNAVLNLKELEVIERHKHGKKVSYVPDNKDAAVSYGNLDFKFKNNFNFDIKLLFETDDKTLTVKILSIV